MPIEFVGSPRSSLGVEWELELVDATTRELTSGAPEILRVMGEGREGGHPKAKPELLRSTVEVITGICQTVAEARADLAATVAEVVDHAEAQNLRVLCSGTHPFTDWTTQEITDEPRYQRLVQDMQWPARQLQIFGVHVHVGVRSGEKAVAMVNALCAYLPHLLALSASSPYWLGNDTGLASSRSKVFEGLPTAGIPYQLSGWEEFERFMDTLIEAQTIASIREVWWDVRPHPMFGTVELRMCDGMPRLSEVMTVAALAQCLVERFNGQLDRGYTLPVPRSWIVRENKWRAARHGLDTKIIVDDSGAQQPLSEAVLELVDELLPYAHRLGCAEELTHARTLVAEGPSYRRQRAVVAAGGDLRAVVDSLVEELRTDRAATRRTPA